jgi:hypothetical protein
LDNARRRAVGAWVSIFGGGLSCYCSSVSPLHSSLRPCAHPFFTSLHRTITFFSFSFSSFSSGKHQSSSILSRLRDTHFPSNALLYPAFSHPNASSTATKNIGQGCGSASLREASPPVLFGRGTWHEHATQRPNYHHGHPYPIFTYPTPHYLHDHGTIYDNLLWL